MNSQTLSSRADLEFAEGALRDALAELKEDAKTDAQSLKRMLVHLINMHDALSRSPGEHSNVAKRLGDFSVTVMRMVSRNPEAGWKLMRLSDVLRTSSERLREWTDNMVMQPADVIPTVASLEGPRVSH